MLKDKVEKLFPFGRLAFFKDKRKALKGKNFIEKITYSNFEESTIKQRIQTRFWGKLPQPTSTINSPFGSFWEAFCYLVKMATLNGYDEKYFNILVRDDFSTTRTMVEEIVRLLINSVQKEASKLGEIEMKEARTITEEIEKILLFDSDLKDLYMVMIRSYTLQTFLYQQINNLLRNEDWENIVDLLPYIIYLLISCYHLSYHDSAKIDKGLTTVYRGTRLSPEQILVYESFKETPFSWNSFTSTSKDPNISKLFSGGNADDGLQQVLFIIELKNVGGDGEHPFSSISKFSVEPDEEEVIITPGALYIFKDKYIKDNYYCIHLQLITSYDLGKEFYVPMKSSRDLNLLEFKQSIEKKEDTLSLVHITDNDLEIVLPLLSKGADFIKLIKLQPFFLSSSGIERFIKALAIPSALDSLTLDTSNIRFKDMDPFMKYLPQIPITKLNLIVDPETFVTNMVKNFVRYNSFRNLEQLGVELPYSNNKLTMQNASIEFLSALFLILPETKIIALTIDNVRHIHKLSAESLYSLAKSNVRSLNLIKRKVTLIEIHRENIERLQMILIDSSFKAPPTGTEYGHLEIQNIILLLKESNIQGLTIYEFARDVKAILMFINALPHTKLELLYFSICHKEDSQQGSDHYNADDDDFCIEIIEALVGTLPKTKIKMFGCNYGKRSLPSFFGLDTWLNTNDIELLGGHLEYI